MTAKSVRFTPTSENKAGGWKVPGSSAAFDEEGIKSRLLMLEHPCHVVREGERIGLSNEGFLEDSPHPGRSLLDSLAWIPPLPIARLGDADFRETHGTSYSYYAGAMATGIASEQMVIALGKEGFLGSFGAAGLLPNRVKEAIVRIQRALPEGPYAFNLIYSPNEPALEQACVDLYLTHGVRCVEAAAYLDLTPHVVRYRVAGLALDAQNRIQVKNRIIAKVSRREVATKFMNPAPQRILQPLLEQGVITEQQAELSQRIPMADDVTVEADSAGHTDNRPMLALLPSILVLRDEIQAKQGYEQPVRVGAGGGIGTPTAALATFIMGAAYVVTGSINQSCIEAGTSGHAKRLLAKIDMADVTMAPAADMFEMGVQLQVLKRGLLFPMRARKLYDLFRNYGAIEEIPPKERKTLEEQIFKTSLESIWESTVSFFSERDPGQIEKAMKNPRRKMALTFRWYLGLSSQWAVAGEPGREMDYQIWCGPSMGAFNAWVRGSYLEEVDNRRVVDVARHILSGAAFSYRVQQLRSQGLQLTPACSAYAPPPISP
ncbi:PfaD family polyunsaturated fatty acid/polyketide biosynthesis protein [Thermodesulfobacteriota bacterium]